MENKRIELVDFNLYAKAAATELQEPPATSSFSPNAENCLNSTAHFSPRVIADVSSVPTACSRQAVSAVDYQGEQFPWRAKRHPENNNDYWLVRAAEMNDIVILTVLLVARECQGVEPVTPILAPDQAKPAWLQTPADGRSNPAIG